MKLYLVHHGEAVPKEQNPDRPLTNKGRADLERLAIFLEQAGIRPGRLIHSGKTRARETAEILAAKTKPDVNLERKKGIKPDDAVEPLSKEISGWHRDTLVAGHGPFISRLIPFLLTGDQDQRLVASTPGTIFCLERDAAGDFRICWVLAPELLMNK